jgi:hypothetical protein
MVQHQTATREKIVTLSERRPRLRRPNMPAIAPGVVLSVLLCMLALRPLALTQFEDVPLTNIVTRPYGDAQQALDRIQDENFTTVRELNRLTADPNVHELQRLVYRYAPIIVESDQPVEQNGDTFIGVYYLLSQTTGDEITVTTIQYFYYSTDESGGTLIQQRLALFGQPIDRELIYRVTLVDGEPAGAHYQAPVHRLASLKLDGSQRPMFAVASANNNFRPVLPLELERREDAQLLAPLPHNELAADPAHDPDFVALAAREALTEHNVDLSHYLYIEFNNPLPRGLLTISALVGGRWYYLHESITGLTRPGFNRIGVYIGYAPDAEQVETLRIVAFTTHELEIEVISIYVYPSLTISG